MVHGPMGSSAQWEDHKSASGDTYEVIALDLPGFGCNASLPVISSIAGFADWVIGELAYRSVKRFNLLGHSKGGIIVQDWAKGLPSLPFCQRGLSCSRVTG